MGKTYTWADVDRLYYEWYDMPEEGNEGRRKSKLNEIFLAAMEVLEHSPRKERRRVEAIDLFFIKDWDRFDPVNPEDPDSRMSFAAYLRKRLKFRFIDSRNSDIDGPWKQIKDADAEDFWSEDEDMDGLWREGEARSGEKKKPKKAKMRPASLDAPIPNSADSEGNQTTLGALQVDPSGREAFDEMFLDVRIYECVALILELSARLRGRANNPERINYFRLFFTDGVTNCLRSDRARAFAKHERDLFQAMKVTFMDFFLTSVCRTVAEVAASDLKPYGELVEGKGEKPVKQPLPNDVYKAYLEQVEGYKAGLPAISMQRQAYRAFLKEQLC